MKRLLLLFSIIALALIPCANVRAQESDTCDFVIAGTWQVDAPGQAQPTYYRFATDGSMKVLARSGQDQKWIETASANYKINDVWAPKTIEFTPINGGNVFKAGTTAMQITQFNEGSMTTVAPGEGPAHWTRVDSHRYFVVFAGRMGTARDGAPQFAMLIKTQGTRQQIESFGVYPVRDESIGKNVPVIGPIPDNIISEFVNEPDPSWQNEAMLRLELTPAEYARSLRVMRDWEKRASQDELLYPIYYMDNVIFVDQLAKSVDSCDMKIKEYNMTWLLSDKVIADHNLPQVVFYYTKELRRMNDSLHVTDAKLYKFTKSRDDLPPED